MDASRHRAEPNPACPYCKGSGIVSVSKDPDLVDECTCVLRPEEAGMTVSFGGVPDGTIAVVVLRWTDAGELEARFAESRTAVPAPRDSIVDALVQLALALSDQRRKLDAASEVGNV